METLIGQCFLILSLSLLHFLIDLTWGWELSRLEGRSADSFHIAESNLKKENLGSTAVKSKFLIICTWSSQR
jgi:hypothetical protein